MTDAVQRERGQGDALRIDDEIKGAPRQRAADKIGSA